MANSLFNTKARVNTVGSYTKRSDTIRVAGATPLTIPHIQTNHRFWVCKKIIFFDLGMVPINFFDPQRPYLALKTSLLGGSYF